MVGAPAIDGEDLSFVALAALEALIVVVELFCYNNTVS